MHESQAIEVKHHFNMIEDYVQTMAPPIAQNVTGRFITLHNTHISKQHHELISVSNNNELIHFTYNKASNSGWQHELIAVDQAPEGEITKLISFYQEGVLYCLVHYPSNSIGDKVVGMKKTPAQGWETMPFSSEMANDLGQMTQTDRFCDANGQYYFYGVTENISPATFIIGAFNPDNHQWENAYRSPAENGASYQLLQGEKSNDNVIMQIKGNRAQFQEGEIIDGHFNPKNETITHTLTVGAISAQQVFAIPAQASNENHFLLLDDQHRLLCFSNYLSSQLQIQILSGGAEQPTGINTVALGVDVQQRAMVFAIDKQNNRLWLLRQNDDTTAFAFNAWVPLGNTLQTISCPTLMAQGPEVFTYDLSQTVAHLSQQVSEGNWFSQTLAVPSPTQSTPVHTTTYTHEIIISNDKGAIQADEVINVYSDRQTTLLINGLSYRVNQTTPATVKTNSRGKLTIANLSHSLISPILYITVEALGEKRFGPYRCDARVHDRIAGKDEDFPVDGSSMKEAGIIPPSIHTDDADTLAKHVSKLGQALQGKVSEKTLKHTFKAAPFEIDFTQEKTHCRNLTAEEYAERFVNNNVASDIWGDICHYFKHAIDDLKKIAISIDKETVTVIVYIGKEAKKLILKTAHQIADCLEMVIKAIAALAKDIVNAIEKALEWLRMLLHWDDVLLTKQAIDYLIKENLNNIQTSLKSDAPEAISQGLDFLKKEVTTAFDNAEKQFVHGASFNSIMGKPKPTPATTGGKPLAAHGLKDKADTHAVQSHFVHAKVNQGCGSSNLLQKLINELDKDEKIVEELLTSFEKNLPLDTFENSFAKMQQWASDIHNIQSFADVAILELIEAAKDLILLVLDGIEGFLITLCKIAGGAFKTFEDIITYKIDILGLNSIYKMVADADLTLLDVLSLMVALPTTILHIALYKGKAPFTQAQVNKLTHTPLPWPTMAQFSNSNIESMPLGESFEDVDLAIIFMLGAFAYAGEDIYLDYQAAKQVGGSSAIADQVNTVLMGWGAIFTSLLLQGTGLPLGVLKKCPADRNTADNFNIAIWALAFMPVASDMVFGIGSRYKKITRFQGKVGPLISSGMGTISLLTAVIGTEYMQEANSGYNTANIIDVILPPLPYVLQPFVLFGLDTEDGAVLNGMLSLCDLTCDVGMGVSKLIGTIQNES